MSIRSIGICVKPDQPQLAEIVRGVQKWLAERGVETLLDPEAGSWTRAPSEPRSRMAERVDAILVLGGDGTLLAVARASGTRSVPILGVSLGTLGFLAEIAREELTSTLELLLEGKLRGESRLRMEVRVEAEGEARGGPFLALNDAVVTKTDLSRIVDLEARMDDAVVTTYHADGLIVATPTGSTAYSLSAGGPLLLPTFEAIVLTPICPHTLSQRPLVLPSDAEVAVRVQDTRGGEVRLTVDGQVGCALREGDWVRVRRSPHPACLLVPEGRNRFEVLRAKLGWGER